MWQGFVYRVWQAISVDVGFGNAFVSSCYGVQWASFRSVGDLPIVVYQKGVEVQEVNIDLDAFCSWLCEHEKDEVGRPGIWFHSPLALWLSEVTGALYGVDGGVYGRACWDEQCWSPLPRWAVVFSSRVEQWLGRTMVGSEALEVLAQVEYTFSRQIGCVGQHACTAKRARGMS
jgi:hypothetical protein